MVESVWAWKPIPLFCKKCWYHWNKETAPSILGPQPNCNTKYSNKPWNKRFMISGRKILEEPTRSIQTHIFRAGRGTPENTDEERERVLDKIDQASGDCRKNTERIADEARKPAKPQPKKQKPHPRRPPSTVTAVMPWRPNRLPKPSRSTNS